MKGPTSSKATGLLTLPADVTFDTQVVINKADRSVGVINQRSNVPLTYTITKQQADGTLDLFTEDLSLQSSDFNGQVASGLFLVEGSSILRTELLGVVSAQDKRLKLPTVPLLKVV